MRLPKQEPNTKNKLLLETKSERNRMIAMSVLFVMVLIAFFGVRAQESRYRQSETETLPQNELLSATVKIAAPEIDAERIGELVADMTETDRVLLDRDAIDFALEQTHTLADAHFAPLAGRELDDLSWRELQADAAGWRGALFRVRGRIEELKREEGVGGELWRGRVTTADERPVYFALRQVPSGLEVGDWMRFDALFLKLFRDEVAGSWLPGPLLAGRRAKRSFEPLGTVTELGPYDFLDVTDSNRDYGGNLEDFEPELYRLLAYARDVGSESSESPQSIDWDAAPLLEDDVLKQIFEDGSSWRGQPVRLPPLRLLGVTNIAVGENPARLEKVSDGWIGSQTWTASNGLIHFRAPFTIENLGRKDLVTGRGFFFMNEKYEPQKGGLSVACFFVIQELERHAPPVDNFARNLILAVCALALILIGLFWFALTRDARRGKEFRQELVRRRRERRAKAPTVTS